MFFLSSLTITIELNYNIAYFLKYNEITQGLFSLIFISGRMYE